MREKGRGSKRRRERKRGGMHILMQRDKYSDFRRKRKEIKNV